MDRMLIKIIGRVLNITILFITGRIKVTSLQIHPASFSIGIAVHFQRLLKGVKFQFSNIAKLINAMFIQSQNWNTAAPVLLTEHTIINTNPVSADLVRKIIADSGLINTFLACIQTPCIHSGQPDVFSNLSGIGYFQQRFS